jgi:glycosyltransferase involved in cell wall biosynthesis
MHPQISVLVAVFNHENYLEKTFSGIEMQTFEGGLEVVIHDDASTDGTHALCSQYAKNASYPVKIIRQNTNKYSQKISTWPERFAACTGKYIALCEGDDYWTSSLKLANQHVALEYLVDVDICFHQASMIDYKTGRATNVLANYGEEPKLFSVADVIEGDGGFMPTPSIMFRRQVVDTLPSWFYSPPPVIDYFLQVFSSLRGGAVYLPMNAAAYRYGDPVSWSQRTYPHLQTYGEFLISYFSFLRLLRKNLTADHKKNVDKLALKNMTNFLSRSFAEENFFEFEKIVTEMKSYFF